MATILENEAAWSTTAATNANVDTGINWVENQDAATVNNSARGMMAARRKAALDQGGGLVAGGTANALTVTTSQVLSAAHLTFGLRLFVWAVVANTSPTVTLAVDGLTPINIKRADGSPLVVGTIQAGMALDLVYNAYFSQFWAANIAPIASSQVMFQASSVGDTFATTAAQGVRFTTVLEYGGYFATNGWFPPAGQVLITFNVSITNSSGSSAVFFIELWKTAALAARCTTPLISNGAVVTGSLSHMDLSDGTPHYFIKTSSTAQPYSVTAGFSSFCGHMI